MTTATRLSRRPEWPGWAALGLLTGLMFYTASAPAGMFPRMAPVLPWDKIVHASEWGAWSVLLFALLRRRFPDAETATVFVGTVGAAAVVALLHELYQLSVPGRSCDPMDWLADMTGSVCATLLFERLLPALRRFGV